MWVGFWVGGWVGVGKQKLKITLGGNLPISIWILVQTSQHVVNPFGHMYTVEMVQTVRLFDVGKSDVVTMVERNTDCAFWNQLVYPTPPE
jgi:hypothetical protein